MDERPRRGRPPKNTNIGNDIYFQHGKVPPQAVDFEMALLAMLMDEYIDDDIREMGRLLKIEYFYKEAHQLIFKVIEELQSKTEPVNILTVTEKARQMEVLELIGGAYYITSLMQRKVSSSNALYYFKIVYQKYLLREIIRISSDAIKKAYEDIDDCFDQLDDLSEKIKAIQPGNTFKSHVSNISLADNMMIEIDKITTQGSIIFSYDIGEKRFDDIVSLSRDKILLISGPAGHGKSKFASFLMFNLLERYPKDIAIYWVTLEDSAKSVIWGNIASKVFIKPKDLTYKRYPQKYISEVKEHISKIRNYDITFLEQSSYCKDITNNFAAFAEARKDKFCILLIDNILSLSDRHLYPRDINTMYDSVMSRLLECRQQTKGLIIPIHHFKDAQQDKSQRVYGYRPTLVDLKGTEAFRRVPNQVLMINTPKMYKDLMSEYDGEKKEILKHMFIVDTGKNREDASDDDVALIHFYCNLNFNYFKEIDLEDTIESKITTKNVGVIPV